MRWLIDGYNVIRRDPDLRGHEAEGLEAGRAALLRRLAAVARAREETFTVVFDGARLRAAGDPAGGVAGRVDVLFSRPPESADDVLRRLAARWREGAVVVSSDRAVETAARRAGAVAVSTEDFLDALERGAAPADDSPDVERSEAPSRAWRSPGARDVEDEPRAKRGNPRRLSREDRDARRVLRRLG
jgi:predicted RNA-binding protein with PIN domain